MPDLDEISQYVNQLPFDLKAETLVALLLEQGIDPGEILVSFDGQLKRPWSEDIAWSTVDNLETNDRLLTLHLNRDGIYDSLPEAIFHNKFGIEDQTGSEMAKDSAQLRTEEKESRTFFQPFENEIFLQRVNLVLKENRLLKNIYSEFLMGIIPGFWLVNEELPDVYVSRLKKLLPLVYKISGDLKLTAQGLEFILRENVNITPADECKNDYSQEDFSQSGVLGKSSLGVDTISGNHVSGFINRLIFSIGPVINPGTNELIKNGKLSRFLDCFYGYFIPFEFDVETKFIFETERSQFMLSSEADTNFSYLGLNSDI